MLRKAFKYLILLLILLITFRGTVYRWLVTYKEVGQRQEIPITDQAFLQELDQRTTVKPDNIQQLASMALEITCAKLSFTFKEASANPNKLFVTRQANCVGYAAMYHAVVQYIIHKHQLSSQWQARHLVGRLYIWNTDIHPYFDTPFFKDHDFNEIKDLQTGDTFYADPSVGDYLWVSRVKGEP